MDQQHAQTPPAGWYPDPYNQGYERWWDGANWSHEHARPAQPQAAVPSVPPQTLVQQSAPPQAATAWQQPQQCGAPAQVPVEEPAGESTAAWLVVVGWIGAVIAPIIGLLVGVQLLSRDDDRGKAMIALSLAVVLLHVLFRPLG